MRGNRRSALFLVRSLARRCLHISVLPVPVMSLDQRGVVVDAKDVRHCPRCPANIEIPSVQHFLCNTLGRGELFPARIQQLGDSSLFAICLLNCDVEVAAIVPRTGRTNRMQATARSRLYVFHKVICLPSPDPKRSGHSRQSFGLREHPSQVVHSFSPSAVGSIFVLLGSFEFGYGFASSPGFSSASALRSIPSHITASCSFVIAIERSRLAR